uniref:WASH1 WAHD domain-containing protein n=1 Tax=Alexandrium monilatum TaxID=311494 RepID=A0A7S4T3R2_9DINO|mmetsp:Transcript_88230/g.279084  ORF Transcript_88230/g.279084 Transcript_88230/m.279084 type:complete len:463 (+) Transcript_88230:77-1465(+)
MDSILAALESFHAQTEAVFDSIDAACGQVEARLGAVEERLTRATHRIEASCGSTRPLVVRSAKSFGGQRVDPMRGHERVLGEGALAALAGAAPLPDAGAGAHSPAPALRAAAEDLARVVKCVASERRRGVEERGHRAGDGLLGPRGRLASMPELFLFNSGEQPYRARRETNNLSSPHEEEDFLARTTTGQTQRRSIEGIAFNLDDDEPDPLMEDLRFRPGRSSEVTFDLPDSLDLGGPVANIMWRQQDQAVAETERPAWDAADEVFRQISSSPSLPAPAQSVRQAPPVASSSTPPAHARVQASPGSSRPEVSSADVAAAVERGPFQPPPRLPASKAPGKGGGAGPPLPPPPPPPPAPKPRVVTSAAPEAAAPAKTAAPAKSAPPPPPPPPAKGKGKGPGKGQAPKPPPPKSKGTSAKPPPPKQPGGDTGGKAAMFSALRKGVSLRRVSAPRERTGAAVGRVL